MYRQKYENKLSSTGSAVAAEVDLINLGLTATEEQKNTVLPLLLAGQEAAALPPLAGACTPISVTSHTTSRRYSA